jgi:hypothetical protein
MGVQAPKGLLAIHTHMPGIFPADIDGVVSSTSMQARRG